MNKIEHMRHIDEFEAHYRYDSTYMRELLETSPEGYEKFDNAMPLVEHRELLDANSYWVAKLAAMKSEDCGECLQLNVRMAVEAGIDKAIVEATIKGGRDLPAELMDVYDFAVGVAANILDDEALVARIESRFNKGQLLEFGLCISTAKFFPTTKRALGYTKSCSLLEVAV